MTAHKSRSTISVVIPAYNAGHTLSAALDSVLAQTHPPDEVIVVDDGSTDATATIAGAYGSPVRCMSLTNSGVARARNAGIAAARGDLVAFLDADDVWLPEKLARQTELMDARPDVGLCFTAVKRADENLVPIEILPARDYEDFCEALLLFSNVVQTSSSTSVVRRDLLAHCGGYDPRFSQCADWDLAIRLSLLTTFAPIDEPLVIYRASPTNMSSDIRLLEKDTFAVLDAFYARDAAAPYRPLRARVYANHWLIVSGSYLHAGHRRDAARTLAHAVRTRPGSIRRAAEWPARVARRRLGRAPAVHQ